MMLFCVNGEFGHNDRAVGARTPEQLVRLEVEVIQVPAADDESRRVLPEGRPDETRQGQQQ